MARRDALDAQRRKPPRRCRECVQRHCAGFDAKVHECVRCGVSKCVHLMGRGYVCAACTWVGGGP